MFTWRYGIKETIDIFGDKAFEVIEVVDGEHGGWCAASIMSDTQEGLVKQLRMVADDLEGLTEPDVVADYREELI